MEKSCYNCGASMDEQSQFCPACGSAQIRVAAREPSPENVYQTPNAAGDQEFLPSFDRRPAAAMSGSPLPTGIRWKQYFKKAWPLGLLTGIAIVGYLPIGLLFLPIAVIISIVLYRKNHVGPIRAGQGALLGAALSVLSFIVFVVIFQPYYSAHREEFREGITQAMNDQLARNPNPDVARIMHSFVDRPEGVVLMLSLGLFVFFCFSTIFASVAGALAATTLRRDKHRH